MLPELIKLRPSAWHRGKGDAGLKQTSTDKSIGIRSVAAGDGCRYFAVMP